MFLVYFQIAVPLIVLKLVRSNSWKPLASYICNSLGFLGCVFPHMLFCILYLI